MKTDQAKPTARFICTAENPWSRDKADRADHPDATEVNGTCGCCAHYECPNCKLSFRAELPQ